jgi:hypothetical protein
MPGPSHARRKAIRSRSSGREEGQRTAVIHADRGRLVEVPASGRTLPPRPRRPTARDRQRVEPEGRSGARKTPTAAVGRRPAAGPTRRLSRTGGGPRRSQAAIAPSATQVSCALGRAVSRVDGRQGGRGAEPGAVPDGDDRAAIHLRQNGPGRVAGAIGAINQVAGRKDYPSVRYQSAVRYGGAEVTNRRRLS